MITDPALDYESLKYIELRGGGDKRPAKKWGGYSQDFDEAEHVLNHESVVSHSSEEWAIVDIEDRHKMSLALLVFDFDKYKLPDDFDASRVDVPTDTLVTESQSGGLHIYYALHAWRGQYSESDFNVHDELDIDIRGSAVSMHVVAPNDIPGVAGDYEIIVDEPIKVRPSPSDVVGGISIDGEPAIEFDENSSPSSSDCDWDIPEQPPDDLPKCYHAGLCLRREAPDDHPNTHKVNVLAALCGLAAGFNPEDVCGHMCGEYAPEDGEVDVSDKEKTQYQVQHLFEKLESGDYSPPSVSTLQSYGIIANDESCDCEVHSDGESAIDVVREFIQEYDTVEERPEKPDLDDDDVDPDDPDVQEKLNEWPSDFDKRNVMSAVCDMTDEDFDLVKSPLAARLKGMSERGLEQQRSLIPNAGSLMNHDGEFVKVMRGGVEPFAVTETILNFELDVESLLDVEGEGRMANIEVRPSEPSESAFEMQIEPRVFNDARRFKDEVLAERFSTAIESSMHDSDVMDVLRKWIGRQDVPQLTGQKQMGLARNADEFVTPNGVIDSDGWSDDPETVFVERDVGAERKFGADPGDYGDVDSDEIGEMVELFSRTRDPERFLPVLGWMYAAPFRPLITDRTGSFNLLFVDGESGVGKTGTLGVGSRMFGMSAEPFSCSDTTFATITTLASSRGVPMWLDEYKESEMADWQKSKLHELLRKAATGGVEQRGNADKTTDEYFLRAPVVVSGETRVRGSAEQRRAIDVTFRDAPTNPDTPEYERFKQLVGDAVTDEDGNVTFPDARYELEEHAVAYYAFVAGMDDAEFEEKWFGAREYVSERLAQWDTELDDLEVQGLQTVTFGFRVMREFAAEVGADVSKLPGEDELDDALRRVADVDGKGRETHTDEFLGLCARAASADYLEKDQHYTFVHNGEEIRLDVNQSFDAVSKYVRDHGLSADLLGSARDYKQRFREADDKDDSYVSCTSQNTPPLGRCTGITAEIAEEEIEGFDRRLFGENDGDGGDGAVVEDDSDSDGDGGGPTPLNSIDSTDDYVTVTAEVVTWSPTPEKVAEANGPIESGSVADATGRRDVVLFDCDPGSEPAGISHMEEGEAVRVEHAAVNEFDGSPQIVLDSGTTITPIQQGVGHTESADVPEGQATVGEGGDGDVGGVRADGSGDTDAGDDGDVNVVSVGDGDGGVQAERREFIKDVVSDEDEEVGESEVVERCVEEFGADESTVENDVEKMKMRGELYEPREGVLRVVGVK